MLQGDGGSYLRAAKSGDWLSVSRSHQERKPPCCSDQYGGFCLLVSAEIPQSTISFAFWSEEDGFRASNCEAERPFDTGLFDPLAAVSVDSENRCSFNPL